MSDTAQQQPLPTGGSDEGANGFFVGTEPAQPRNAMSPNQTVQTNQPQQPIQQGQPNGLQPSGTFFTADDIEKARVQERDKLYERLNTMEAQLEAERQRKAEEDAARQAEAEALAAEARQKEEAEMETRQLLERKETEWNERFTELQKQNEQTQAVYEQERRLAELERYRNDRLAQEGEFIMPELRDLVAGSSIEAVDASIEEMKQRTEAIMGNLAQQAQVPPPMMYRGASPTAPPVGPLEQMSVNQSLTPEDIASMDIETYRQHRDGLLAAARQAGTRGF